MRNIPKPLGVLCLLAGLAASGCGGGGSEAAPVAALAPSPAPAPSPTPAPPAQPGTRATCELSNFQSEALALVNAQRAAGAVCGAQSYPPAPALSWNNALTQASLVHSDDMAALNFFSHTGSSGSSAGQRATAAGYIWSTWGENLAAGQPTVSVVVAGWIASPGHCANLMQAAFRDIGLACVRGGASNTYSTYWTMTLGAQR